METFEHVAPDMTEAARFLRRWFGGLSRGYLQLSTLKRGGGLITRSCPLGVLERPDAPAGAELPGIAQDVLADALAWAERANNAGCEVYVRTAPVRGRPESGRGDMSWCSALPGLWHEVDVAEAAGHKYGDRIPQTWDEALAWIEALPLPPTTIIQSGGGYHLWWCADEPLHLYDARGLVTPHRGEALKITRAWGHLLGGLANDAGFALDTNIAHNLACLLRLPGTLNFKRAEPTLVHVAGGDGVVYSWDDLREVTAPYVGADQWRGADLDGEQAELAGGSAGGHDWSGLAGERVSRASSSANGRNDACKAFVAAKLADGWDVQRTARGVLEYDRARHDVPLFGDRSESSFVTDNPLLNALAFTVRIVTSIHNQARMEGRTPDWGQHRPTGDTTQLDALSTANVFSFGDLARDRSAYEDHLVEGLIPERSFVLLAGAPKSMKSFLSMDLAKHLALGRDWLGFSVLRPLRVLYVQFELEDDLLRRRAHLLADGLEPEELDRLAENFLISPRLDVTLDAHNVDQWVEWTEGQIARQGLGSEPPEVIIFDPLRNMISVDENDNALMLGWVQTLMRRYVHRINPRAAAIMVHHCRKVSKRDMEEDPFNAIRGASSLRGYYTSCVMVAKPSEESEDRRLWFDLRSGPAPAPMTVRFMGSTFVEVQDETPRAGATQREQWTEESRRVRDRILTEINRRAALHGDLYTKTTLAQALADAGDMPSRNTLGQLLKDYATQGYVRFCDGVELGLPSLRRGAHGYVVTESTMLRRTLDDGRDVWVPVSPTHAVDYSSGVLVELPSEEADRWTYEDGLYDPGEVAWPMDRHGRAVVDPFNTRGLRRNLINPH